ncbi:MAG: M12 family metallo-peptidase [Gammaproteobacteria bacterium]|nr:M12 family metallo-peptidase [Gammaproteobacteria bacterium]
MQRMHQDFAFLKCIKFVGLFWLGLLLLGCEPLPPIQTISQTAKPQVLLPNSTTNTFVRPRALSQINENAVQAVQINPDLVNLPLQDIVALQLPDGRQFDIQFNNRIVHANGDVTLQGVLSAYGPPYFVQFTFGVDSRWGRVLTPTGSLFLQETVQGGWLIDEQLAQFVSAANVNDALQLPGQDNSNSSNVSISATPLSITPRGTHVTVIDVLVLHGSDLVQKYPQQTLQTRVNDLFASANAAFANSLIGIEVRPVFVAQLNVDSTLDNAAILSAMTNGQGGFATVSTLRQIHGADLVTFIRPFNVQTNGNCGVSWLNGDSGTELRATSGFSVVSEGADGQNLCHEFTLAHELGHGMGSAHETANATSQGVFPYSYGHGVPDVFGTVMSYVAPQVGLFSNPNVNTCAARSCGLANQADNSLSLNNVRDTIAAFYATANAVPSAPIAQTDPATEINTNSATLNASIEPQGQDTTVYYDYGSTIQYGSQSTRFTVPGNTTQVTVPLTINGLACGQSYHFRVVAQNSQGETLGANQSFSTAICTRALPEISNTLASSVTVDSARLTADINSNSNDLSYHFEYGTSAQYGQVTISQSLAATSALQPVFADIAGLKCNTNYQFRLVVDSAGTTINGVNSAFTTQACALTAPTVMTDSASNITQTSARLNGQVNPNGLTAIVVYEYGIDAAQLDNKSGNFVVGGVTTSTPANYSVRGLTCATTYYYRITASTDAGNASGDVLNFTTAACATAPIIDSVELSIATSNSLSILVGVDARGEASEVFLDYGVDSTFGLQTSLQTISGGNTQVQILQFDINTLNCDQLYQVRVNIKNSSSNVQSATYGFSTLACNNATLPTVDAVSVGLIPPDNIEVSARVQTNGDAVAVWVEYGIDLTYGQKSLTHNLVDAVDVQQVLIPISNLQCGQSIHLRLVVSTASAQVQSPDQLVPGMTCAGQILIQTSAVVNPGFTAASLPAKVTAPSQDLQVYFEYGVDTTYGLQTPPVAVKASSSLVNVVEYVTSFNCGTTYQFRAVAQSGNIKQLAGNSSFQTKACTRAVQNAPQLVTERSGSITATSARLYATVDPAGLLSHAFFEYGLTSAKKLKTPQQNIGDATLPRQVQWFIGDLQCGSTYHFRVGVHREDGSIDGIAQFGDDLTFETLDCPLKINSTRLSWSDNTSATFSVSLDTGGIDTEVYMEYWQQATDVKITASRMVNTSTTFFLINGLECATDYRVKTIAENFSGRIESAPSVFTTAACDAAPVAQTILATEVTESSAKLNALVLPNTHHTSVYFEYGQSENYGNVTATSTLLPAFSDKMLTVNITDLFCETQYHYRVNATSVIGESQGNNKSFSTEACQSGLPVTVNEANLFAGYNTIVARRKNGSLLAWGDNAAAQLGLSDTGKHFNSLVLDQTGKPLQNIVQVAVGDNFVLALDSQGQVWAWGDNSFGQLGDTTLRSRNFAGLVQDRSGADMQDIIAIAAGQQHGLALNANGNVWAWGHNDQGQLGSDVRQASATPTMILSVSNARQISAGNKHNVALLQSGQVIAWGDNSFGQLGNGTNESSSQAVVVESIANVRRVVAGANQSFVIHEDSRLSAWGANNKGQLGLGTQQDQAVPVRLGWMPPSTIDQLVLGQQHTIALLRNKRIWVWGDNFNGQIALQSASLTSLPSEINHASLTAEDNAVTIIAATNKASIALTQSGGVLAWGDNSSQQLGFNQSEQSVLPVDVLDQVSQPLSLTAQQLLIDTNKLTVKEGGEASLSVKLPAPPNMPIRIEVSLQNNNETLAMKSPNILEFDASNWDQAQFVTIEAERDTDRTSGQADLLISAPGYNTTQVEIVEQDQPPPLSKSTGASHPLFLILLLCLISMGRIFLSRRKI